MNYFNGITDLEQAKQRYRTLAKQLHPDKGGTTYEFQRMQAEYKELLLGIKHKRNIVINTHQPSPENELLSELGNLARVLLKKQVPQDYLRKKMHATDSLLKKGLIGDIVDLLDNL
ncbi:J domain-containing protein [Saccharicrinis aurantiacus]|uniref:J domain-containing protein n=1 Tax=Saccharicrinis aurantiacus TaxID=1849719 RepID=UPI00094FCAB6|nr:J domain-containing protein [Saccharicrinis aurantiacus]